MRTQPCAIIVFFCAAGCAKRIGQHRSATPRAALAHGRDDPRALTLAGFSIGMDGHDRAAAFIAMDAALSISPSSALTYILGSVMHAWGGEAESAIEWSERGMRLSPLDPWAFAAFDAQALSYFHLGRYDKAAQAAHKSIHANPAHSITYVQLAAALSKLGRIEDAKSGCGKGDGIAPRLPIQPSIRRGRLRTRTGRFYGRSAPSGRSAGVISVCCSVGPHVPASGRGMRSVRPGFFQSFCRASMSRR